jgi:RNA polymerase sigma factor (sigma-70 family)
MQQDSEHLELVQKAVFGDRESLSLLAEIAQRRVRAYVQRVVLREDRAADITQETMVAMLGSLGQLRDPKRFWPWVFTIASNKVRQSFRRADLHPVGLSEVQDTWLEPRSDDCGPAEGLSRRELVDITRDAMEELDVRYRMVLAMRFYEDLPHSAIGGVLGCSEMVARITFLRAERAFLRALRRRGIAESSLIAALLAFGRHTAPAGAAMPKCFVRWRAQEFRWRNSDGVGLAACDLL